MDFRKVDVSKKWRKLDVHMRQQSKFASKPLARICKGRPCLSFNSTASKLAEECGLENKMIDLYQAGNEFAVTAGDSVTINFYQHKGRDKGKYCNITAQDAVRRMWLATKCRVFRVSRDGYYLILTPAYDLDTAQDGEKE